MKEKTIGNAARPIALLNTEEAKEGGDGARWGSISTSRPPPSSSILNPQSVESWVGGGEGHGAGEGQGGSVQGDDGQEALGEGPTQV